MSTFCHQNTPDPNNFDIMGIFFNGVQHNPHNNRYQSLEPSSLWNVCLWFVSVFGLLLGLLKPDCLHTSLRKIPMSVADITG